MRRLAILFLLGLGLCVGRLAAAHHSFAAVFDGNQAVTLAGEVVSVEWANPHFHFSIDVKDAGGAVTRWRFEGYPPNMLVRQGWRRDETLTPGAKVTVEGWAHAASRIRRGALGHVGGWPQARWRPAGRDRGALMSNAKAVSLGPAVLAALTAPLGRAAVRERPAPRTADGKPDMSGIWVATGAILLFEGEEAFAAARAADAAAGRPPGNSGEPPPYNPKRRRNASTSSGVRASTTRWPAAC